MKYIKNHLIYIIVATVFVVFLTFAYQSGSQQTAYDFSTEAAQASEKKLAAKGQDSSKEQLDDVQADEQPKNEQASDVGDKDQPDIVQMAQKKTTKTPGSTEEVVDNGEANQIEITEEATEENRYFTTNIIDGQTVTEPIFYVTLVHLNETLKVEQQQVTLNGELLKDYKGELELKEGPNKVTFAVTYVKQDGQHVSAKLAYTITLNTKDIVIFTNLQNKTVNEQKLSFTASAKRKSEAAAVTVKLNGKTLKALGGTAYSTELDEGVNTISIEASLNGEAVVEQYEIVYEEQQALLQYETDLTEHRAAKENYSFYARAVANGESVPLSVTFNDTQITGNEAGEYAVTLKHGVNTIHVTGQYETEKLTKQYRILYKDPTVVEEEKVDPQAPKLVTDLKDGTQVKGDIKTINVWPTTSSGERIRGKNVLVKVNGTAIPFTWDDSVKTSYKLVLNPGENNVSIKIWDDDGRTITEQFVVHSQQVEDNGVIGQVTMSLEASTLGINYLIPPTKVDIHKGEKGSYVLDQFLRNHGFTYSHTGTMTTGFYLKDISKPGMLRNLAIPDDLWALVEKHSTRSERNNYSEDAVGEFDFANGSGWMYSINGDYPNYGFSDAYFLDGDVVRIRYTLHYGKDIGGFEGLGGANDAEWSKQW